MDEVDVEGACAYILQQPSCKPLGGEGLLIVAEEHDYHYHEGIHGQRLWQVGPFACQVMPLEDVGAREEGGDGQQGKEESGVEKTLCLLPMAMDYVAEQEEMKKLECLVEGAVHHEVSLVPLPKFEWQIEG